MRKEIVVYKHLRNDTNEVFYVGIGLSTRPYSLRDRNKYWRNIVNKVGYTIEIVMENLDWETACKEEISLIAKYGRKDNNTGILVNMTDGGQGGYGRIPSKETREKMSIANINKIRLAETCKRISVAKMGIVKNKETKKKMSESHIGNIIPNEVRRKISESLKNHSISDETRIKMSKSALISMQSSDRRNINRMAKSDKTSYTFIRMVDGLIVTKTRLEMVDIYNLTVNGLYRIINKITKSHKGWIIMS
jgi:hypothetical protein